MTLQIEQIPAFEDNYLYLLTCSETGETCVIDPGDPEVIIKALGDRTLNFIWNTHHHTDHVGGNEVLKKKYGCKVISSLFDAERGVIPAADKGVEDGDEIKLGHCYAQVIASPGHTDGHIMYWFEESRALFCGDTLFSAGCGKLFEGTADEMFLSLWRIKSLPHETDIYCAHEYTKENLEFALSQEPENRDLLIRYEEVCYLRDQNAPTVPSTLEEELKSNLFLKAESAVDFAKLRSSKDEQDG
jgi:hydroxyacylglutathione hydrolase